LKSIDDERYSDRAERFLPSQENPIEVSFSCSGGKLNILGFLTNISKSGFQCLCLGSSPSRGTLAEDLSFKHGLDFHRVSKAKVIRSEIIDTLGMAEECYLVGMSFDQPEEPLLETLKSYLISMPYVTQELKGPQLDADDAQSDFGDSTSLFDRYFCGSKSDLFSKCADLYEALDALKRKGHYQHMWRVTLTSALDNHITFFNPLRRCEQKALCFDSNSYLGLHTHPKVVEAARKALDKFGCGSPSSQLLSGTHRYLRELEETASNFHSREETLIFTSRLSAIHGVLRGLLRKEDVLLIDESSHAAVQECHKSTDSMVRQFDHACPQHLENLLTHIERESISGNILVATDGVFEMNGAEAPLEAVAELCRRNGAKLMLDESHSIGIMGPTGRGTEEKFSMIGAADIIVGSFCTTAGALGGYASAKKEVIQYLRFYARSGLFDATLPAHICAGAIEAFRIMQRDSSLRDQLWRNVEYLTPKLKDAGFTLANKTNSPIISIQIGEEKLLGAMSKDLFRAGIRCGMALYPAVAKKESCLRVTLNANHSTADLIQCLDKLYAVGKKHQII